MSKAVEQLLLKQVELQQVVREGIQRLCQPQDNQLPLSPPPQRRLAMASGQRASMLAGVRAPSPIGSAPPRASSGSNAVVPNDSTRGAVQLGATPPLPRSLMTNTPHRRAPLLPFAPLPRPPARRAAPPVPPG